MTDYTQYGEQAAILEACDVVPGLEQKRVGRFLDIGGYDPRDKSNTRALFECGWTGVIIEPEPHAMLRLIAEYGNEARITLVQAAVGAESSCASKFWVTADGTATDVEAFHDKWKEQVKYDGCILVPHITMAQIMLQFGGFNMVSIDVEGMSADIAIQLFQSQMLPRCVVVEHDDRLVEIGQAAMPRGYSVTLLNGTNAVFRR
jgi:FkbM family methyltransferase